MSSSLFQAGSLLCQHRHAFVPPLLEHHDRSNRTCSPLLSLLQQPPPSNAVAVEYSSTPLRSKLARRSAAAAPSFPAERRGNNSLVPLDKKEGKNGGNKGRR